MNIEKIIRGYLPQVVHLSLATSLNNHPWVCEVHFSYDDDLNLYFMSTKKRRHSLEIAQNPQVAGNIITQHFLGQKVRGVYFEGKATLLDEVDQNHPAYITYSNRFGEGRDLLSEASSPDGHAFYQISVSRFYLFDGYESSPSQKYELTWAASE